MARSVFTRRSDAIQAPQVDDDFEAEMNIEDMMISCEALAENLRPFDMLDEKPPKQFKPH